MYDMPVNPIRNHGPNILACQNRLFLRNVDNVPTAKYAYKSDDFVHTHTYTSRVIQFVTVYIYKYVTHLQQTISIQDEQLREPLPEDEYID